jgi:hypothetical protein
MTCPNLYIGNSLAEAPPTPFWQNPAIDPASTDMTEGVPVTIPVTVRNAGTDDSPDIRLQLYWSNPTTGFMALMSRQIGQEDYPTVPGMTTFPAEDGFVTHTFNWNPTNEAATTNGGHVCLLARVRMLSDPPDTDGVCEQQIYGADPTTDPLQGIRNIHVYEASMMMAEPGFPGGGDDGNDMRFMQFAFAATNILRDTEDTRLTVRVLDPGKDRKALKQLVADRLVDRTLRSRRLKFAVPDALLVGAGRERVVVPRFLSLGRETKVGLAQACAPRLSRTGPLSKRRLAHVLAPGEKMMDVKKPIDMKLLPGEMRQTVVQIERNGKDRAVYAVEVRHESAKGKPIGGLTILFVPPHDYF